MATSREKRRRPASARSLEQSAGFGNMGVSFGVLEDAAFGSTYSDIRKKIWGL